MSDLEVYVRCDFSGARVCFRVRVLDRQLADTGVHVCFRVRVLDRQLADAGAQAAEVAGVQPWTQDNSRCLWAKRTLLATSAPSVAQRQSFDLVSECALPSRR